ncbi:TetR/AcrR family transcriptional regulator [Massilia sp. 9I]|uniref:TetR/AcrR family transcriptional regulator n=1 Tax=Massilia sp. 9I TaxID=2653152 RepID=UPI0012EFE7CC|nr:TetR/AcrR family transcriptional regulator [Massilia sp. 9I]VXB12828.1 HTH-type transcriptional regulator CymR [Massilia sp. 9I]
MSKPPADAVRPARRTQTERSTDTQERILAAATEVMRKHGYAGLRVADVTAAAGVSRGAQTHHFPSKVELVQAIFARIFQQASHASLARASAVARGDDVIAALIEDASAFFLGQDFTLGLDMLAAAGRDPELREAVQDSARLNRFAVEGMWTQVLESHGLSRADADDVLWLAFSAIRGLSVRLLWDRDPERFERVKTLAYDAARRLYDSKRAVA